MVFESSATRFQRKACSIAWGIALLPSISGCATRTRSIAPEQDPSALNDMTFLHYLAATPVVTVDEGMRAVLLLENDAEVTSTFDQRKEHLIRLGAFQPKWNLQSDSILDKGTLAFMLRTVCTLPRGLSGTLAELTGWGDRRYALKACIHHKILPYSLPHDPVTGGELLSALTASESYLDRTTANQPIGP